MNEIEEHLTRKKGEYTPGDVLKEAENAIKEHGSKRMVVVIQTKDDLILRYNTELDIVELTGLMEAAKFFEFCE